MSSDERRVKVAVAVLGSVIDSLRRTRGPRSRAFADELALVSASYSDLTGATKLHGGRFATHRKRVPSWRCS